MIQIVTYLVMKFHQMEDTIILNDIRKNLTIHNNQQVHLEQVGMNVVIS